MMAGISAIRYAFPARSATLAELHAAGQLTSPPELLSSFGFERVHVAELESPYALALAAARRLLEEEAIDPASIGLIVYGGPQESGLFRFPASRLQYDLAAEHASVLAVSQAACNTIFAAVRVAQSFLASEGVERALCVVADFFPVSAGREAIFNCTSDAAVAVLVERAAARNRIAGSSFVTKGYYWEGDALRNQLVASYFPTAQYVIAETLAGAGWQPQQVDWVIPHNVSRRSWEILLGLTQLPAHRLWDRNLARDGHTLAGDNFINLADATAAGAVQPGQRLLLFSYGYGAHWAALALEA